MVMEELFKRGIMTMGPSLSARALEAAPAADSAIAAKLDQVVAELRTLNARLG